MNKLVSILIPAYNSERWIAEAIHSAIIQTWPYKEIIIVDDGSRDNTLSIANRFKSKNVHVIAQEHSGSSKARNIAYELSNGDYIQWLDADDVLAPNKIELQMIAAEQFNNPLILFSSAWGLCFRNTKRAKFTPTDLWHDDFPSGWLTKKLSASKWMAIECWLISRTLSEKAGKWDETLTKNNDGEYISRIITHCQKIIFVPAAKVYCRAMNPNSLSKKVNTNFLKSDYFALKKECIYLLTLEDSQRTRLVSCLAIQEWLRSFYPENIFLFNDALDFLNKLGFSGSVPVLENKNMSLFGLSNCNSKCLLAIRLYKNIKRLFMKLIFRILYYIEI